MPDTTIAEAEIIEPAPLPAPRPQSAAVAPTTLFGTSDPAEVIEAATATAEALTSILEERKLYAVMGHDKDGKERRHVQIEGWALLGSMTGVFAATVWTKEILDPKTGKPIGWEARAETHTLAGALVGAAEAECRWAEDNWSDRDSFAIKSMAQTRAQSKSLAMPLRFIVELAGFAGTPAEEMIKTEEDAPKLFHADGHPVYDNTGDPKKMEQRWPAYKCRNRDCDLGEDGKPWATWDKNHFAEEQDPEIAAKQKLYYAIRDHTDQWKLYYPLDDPSYSDDETTLISSIHEADDVGQMAGKMWTDIVAACVDGELSAFDLEMIVATGATVLDVIAKDPEDLMTYPLAWEQTEERLEEARADAAVGTSDYH